MKEKMERSGKSQESLAEAMKRESPERREGRQEEPGEASEAMKRESPEGRGEAPEADIRKRGERQHTVRLSNRLQMLADMVTPGNRLADVGCDHGYLSIELVRAGICPEAIAMDVREGPLAAARAHIAEYGLGGYISVRLSDGLAECGIGEADTCVCAGMGGKLMERILRQGMEKAVRMKELILQPQSELQQFRAFLREAGFTVTQEDAVLEEGKYYFAMKAVYEHSGFVRQSRKQESTCGDGEKMPRERLYDLYGQRLLEGRHPVLRQYLAGRQDYIRRLEEALETAGSRKAETRLEEIRVELADIEAALSFYGESE